jgi:hypothetical protein
MSCNPKPKVLIITSSGGGGLLQAANAKEQEIKEKFPEAVVIQRDVMKDWMGLGFGRLFVTLWNSAQRRGNVFAQVFFGYVGPRFLDWIFWPSIFIGSLRLLFKEDIDQVIDTQAFGTSATIKAIRWFNRLRKKTLCLEKVMVDFPTKRAVHFFPSIRRLSFKDRKFFKLITIKPLLEKGQTKEEFWKTHCNLTDNELQYEDFYVRSAFRKYQNLPKSKDKTQITIQIRNDEEHFLTLQTLHRGSPHSIIAHRSLQITIDPECLMITILLGSQPANNATQRYVQRFIEIARERKTPIHLFVFCANHIPGQDSLFQRVADLVSNTPNYPTNLTVIPMSFQSEETIAALFFRSDITCTRSGGQTAMELMCAGRGEIWIHSETKKPNPTNEDLLAGIPLWESGTALYLQHFLRAKLITPEILELEE